jgi:curved DNA-binding protein CbpA
MEACYDVLGIEKGATIEEAKSAYRQLIKTWHPDRHTNNADLKQGAEEQTKLVNIAFEQFLNLSATVELGDEQKSYQNNKAAAYQWEPFIKEQKSKAQQYSAHANSSKSTFKHLTSLVSTALVLFIFAVSLLTVQNIQTAHAEDSSNKSIPRYQFSEDSTGTDTYDFRSKIASSERLNTKKVAGASVISVRS